MSSPYLKPGRLGDILAAIQIMGVSERYRRTLDVWTIFLSGNVDRQTNPEKFAEKMKHWQNVFDEHPEFFRPSGAVPGAYALGLRRGLPRRYDISRAKLIDEGEYDRMTEQQQRNITRSPLSLDDIKTLIDIALGLHEEANSRVKDRRWFIQLLIPLAGSVFVGLLSFAAVYLKAKT
jgi:hypothetical protein